MISSIALQDVVCIDFENSAEQILNKTWIFLSDMSFCFIIFFNYTLIIFDIHIIYALNQSSAALL